MIINTTKALLEILNLEETIIIKTNTKTIAIIPHNGEISVVDKATDEVVYTSEDGAEFYSDMVKALISQQEGE